MFMPANDVASLNGLEFFPNGPSVRRRADTCRSILAKTRGMGVTGSNSPRVPSLIHEGAGLPSRVNAIAGRRGSRRQHMNPHGIKPAARCETRRLASCPVLAGIFRESALTRAGT